MSTARAASMVQRGVLRRLGHLLSLTSDADRNFNDKGFAGRAGDGLEGGRIHYVFDTNLFELFIHPLKHYTFAENFYATRWGTGRGAKHFSAQAALVAAEFLFSDDLPGLQTDAPIYVTEWHYKELRARLRLLRSGLREKVEIMDSEEQEISRYLARITGLGGGFSKMMETAPPVLQRDVQQFLSRDAENIPAAERFVLARELAELLVDDEVLEPLQQLLRIYSDVLPRVRPLNLAFPIRDAADQESAQKYMQNWIVNLQSSYGAKHKEGRVQFDARSIAYVEWIGDHCLPEDETIAFVTGDSSLFSAYRGWYRSRDAGTEFRLRSVNQYAPLLNPRDMANDLGEPGQNGIPIFENIRAAIESPLITFRIKSKDGDDAVHQSSREHLATMLLHASSPEIEPAISFFTHGLEPRWWQQRQRTFDSLRNHWREAERVAIGVSLPLLEKRLTRLQADYAELITHGDDEIGASFVTYLYSILDEITQESLRFELPEAIGVVREWASKGDFGVLRAPMNVHLEVPFANGGEVETIDFSSLMLSIISGDAALTSVLDTQQNAALLDRVDILFAAAAALSIRRHLWFDAERLAENALSAFNVNTEPDSKNGRDEWEFRYLILLAQRFVLASRRPRHGWQTMTARHEKAAAELGNLVEVHHAHPPLLVRSLSERAAHGLFYVTWIIWAVSGGPASPHARETVGNKLRDIKADLDRASATLAKMQDQPASSSSKATVQINMAALALVATIAEQRMGVGGTLYDEAELAAVETSVKLLIKDLRAYPAVVAVDILGFIVLTRKRPEFLGNLKNALQSQTLSDLPLDRAMADMVREETDRSFPNAAYRKSSDGSRRQRRSR